MPPLSIAWLRGGRAASSAWLTPAQRAVRVLQVTRANWPVLSGGRRKKRHAAEPAPPFVREGEDNLND